MKYYTAAAAALRAAELELTAAIARRDDVLGQCTTARLELAQIEREADALSASESVSVATVRELSQRRAIAEDVARQLDAIATAAAQRTGEAKRTLHRAERETTRAASAFFAGALAEAYAGFWKANRERFAELVRLSNLADSFENAAAGNPGPVRRDLAGVLAVEFSTRIEQLAETDRDYSPRLGVAGKGEPAATAYKSALLSSTDRDLIAANREPLELGQPLCAPDPLEGFSRDRAQCLHQIAEHKRAVVTLGARLKNEPAKAAEINAELSRMRERLERWQHNADLLAA